MLAVPYLSFAFARAHHNLAVTLIAACAIIVSTPSARAGGPDTGGGAFALPSRTQNDAPVTSDSKTIAPDASKKFRTRLPQEGTSLEEPKDKKARLVDLIDFSGNRMPQALENVLEAVRVFAVSIAESPGWRYGGLRLYGYAGVRIERFSHVARNGLNSPTLVTWRLTHLASVYKALGREQEAMSLLEHRLTIAKETAEFDTYSMGVIANRLALICAGSGRPAAAETYFKQAIDAFKKSGGDGGASEASALHKLAILYGRHDRYPDATAAALQSLSLLNQKARQDRNLVDVLDTLGGAYHAQGLHKEAEPFVLRAFWIAHQRFKSSDERLSQVTANLAVIFKDEERFIEAIALFELALEEAEVALGPEDVWAGMIANRLAVTYLELGQIAEAEQLLKRSVTIGENSPGADPLFLSAALFNLSAVYVRQLRYQEAEKLLNQSLSIRLKAYSPSHPAVIEAEHALQAVRKALSQGERHLSAGSVSRFDR